MPACFSMLLSVPIGISRTGCGTVTRPGFTGCLNCLWLPTCATSYQPSCFKRCMTSRLDIRHDTHFLHTRQIGIYRISAAILDRVLKRGRFIYLDGRLGERAISTNLQQILPASTDRARTSGTPISLFAIYFATGVQQASKTPRFGRGFGGQRTVRAIESSRLSECAPLITRRSSVQI
jgi:hypothetical protein